MVKNDFEEDAFLDGFSFVEFGQSEQECGDEVVEYFIVVLLLASGCKTAIYRHSMQIVLYKQSRQYNNHPSHFIKNICNLSRNTFHQLIPIYKNNLFHGKQQLIVVTFQPLIMFQNPEEEQLPQDTFLSNFTKFSQMLLEDNYTNMKNQNQNTQNFTECFSYFKGVIRFVLSICEKIEERNRDLMDQLERIDRNNRLVRGNGQFKKELEIEKLRLSSFVPLRANKANSFATKVKSKANDHGVKAKVATDSSENIRKQFQFIENFIQSHLIHYLVQDKERKAQIPKNLIVTCYEKWSQSRGHQILINKKMLIKMQITNVLKKLFPNIEHTDKHYLGIGFTKGILEDVQVKREPQARNCSQVGQQKGANGGPLKLDQCELQNEDLRNLTFDQFDLENDYGENVP